MPAGDVEPGLAMSDVFSPQLLLELEAGLRFTPAVMASLVLDMGFGGTSSRMRNACNLAGGHDCTSLAVRFALQLRYAFTPYAPATPWIAIGLGGEAAGVTSGQDGSNGDIIWSGAEFPRLSVGYDLRTDRTMGFGLFATVGMGRYSQVDDGGASSDLSRRSTHTWFQVGVRAILGP
jgi:hypothetical protein